MHELERSLHGAVDLFRRQAGSRAAREAGTRKLKRTAAEAFRRARRAAFIFVALILALVVFDVAGASIGFFTWLFALFGIFLAALLSLTLPSRGARKAPPLPTQEAVAKVPLPMLAGRCETWLLDRCEELPHTALPSADLILARLQRMQPALDALPEASPLTADVRRLVGGHLPNLVDSYLALPPETRGRGTENDRRITDSLGVVAEELTRLCGEIDGCREASFEIEHRFIESRYRDDDRLRGN
ncbi:MAG TPA: hypothetical protein VF552_06520 [Allosphingosinicella sp.]